MKILGIYGGIGSMMIGAKKQGWEIIGNIEERPYYHTGTFEKNFPGAWMLKSFDDLTQEQYEQAKECDMIIGHPDCGSFSALRQKTCGLESDKERISSDIKKYINAVKEFKPKCFAMDDLPGSLNCVDWKEYQKALPEYDIFFEWINNYGYGNIQKTRKRLFVIGALKELYYTFVPGEFEHNDTIMDRIAKIAPDAKNDHHVTDEDRVYGWAKHEIDSKYEGWTGEKDWLYYGEFKEYLKKQPLGVLHCYNRKGLTTKRLGKNLVDVDSWSKVVTGGGSQGHHYFYRNDNYMPFTIRERAKIQGCPDDFEFVPDIRPDGSKTYGCLVRQTGKFMPVEFCTYITGQFMDLLTGKYNHEKYTGKRLISPNPTIDYNKYWYCMRGGAYSDQHNACKFCGSKAYCDKCMRKLDKEEKALFADPQNNFKKEC